MSSSSQNIIYFDPSINGLGNCIVGCSSAFILANVLNAEFRVLNGHINFYEFFDIPKEYKAEYPDNVKIIEFTDNAQDIKLFNETNLSSIPSKIIIRSCRNFSRYIYLNKYFKNKISIQETEAVYHLFQKILLPHKAHWEKFKLLDEVLKMEQCICVHVRCDDVWGDSNTDERRFNVDETIKRFAKCINEINKDGNKVILISDNPDRVLPIFIKENIKAITFAGTISHSEKSSSIDYEKTMLDLWTIGSCKDVIISYWSNFGRIGVLRTLKCPMLVDAVINQDQKQPFNFNVDMKGCEFRRAELNELLSKEPTLISKSNPALIPLSQMGYGFYCHYAYCPRIGLWNQIPEFNNEERVFINYAEAPNSEYVLNQIIEQLKAKNIKIYFFIMNEPSVPHYIIEKLIPVSLEIYQQNNFCSHSIVHQMPIGIRDGEEICPMHKGFTQKYLLDEGNQRRTKQFLCVMAFTATTHTERFRCESMLGNVDFITNMNKGSYEAQASKHCGKIPIELFYKRLHESQFTLAPRGEGESTHRFWEAIFLDSIPIVKKTYTAFDKLYDVFPCLIVSDWNEITFDLLKNRLFDCQTKLTEFKAKYPHWWSDLDSIMELLNKT